MEEMMKKLVEMQSKVDHKGKKVRLEDDDVESVHPYVHSPRESNEGGMRLNGERAARRHDGGEGGTVESYGRSYGLEEPGTGLGGGLADPWRYNRARGDEEMREPHQHYRRGNTMGRGNWGMDARMRKLKMPIFEEEDAQDWIYMVE